MIEMNKCSIEDVTYTNIDLPYHTVPDGEVYRSSLITEIIDLKNSVLEVPGFESNELDDILTFLCVS